jgi:hypothetical protein
MPGKDHLMPVGTAGPMETLLWQLEELSNSPACQSRYSRAFIWLLADLFVLTFIDK